MTDADKIKNTVDGLYLSYIKIRRNLIHEVHEAGLIDDVEKLAKLKRLLRVGQILFRNS